MGCNSIRGVQELEDTLQDLRKRHTNARAEKLRDRLEENIHIHVRKTNTMPSPLPIKNGLNPTRAQVPVTWEEPVIAADFLWRLISTQRHRHPEDTELAVLERFARGEVCSDRGLPFSAQEPLAPGTWVNFYRRPAPERPVPFAMPVLFQDRDVVVVDKPPFLATVPRGQHIAETAVTRARVELDNPLLVPAHRLDRLTSGVLMFTARREVRGAYQTLFDRRVPRKTYEAVTVLPQESPYEPVAQFAGWGDWQEPTESCPWRLEQCLVKIQGRLSAYVGDAEVNAVTLVTGCREELRLVAGGANTTLNMPLNSTDHNTRADTDARTSTALSAHASASATSQFRRVLVWTLVPSTGRTHQLRVLMRSLGVPIINDPLYSDVSDEALHDPQGAPPTPVFVDDEDFTAPLGLIARELSFTDPLSGEPRVFRSER